MKPRKPPSWHDDAGRPIACQEDIKTLDENYLQLRQMICEALELGLRLGCSDAQMRVTLLGLVDEFAHPCSGGE